MVNNGEFPTIDTSLSAFLVQQGFDLQEIRYSELERSNKRQATYIFKDSPEIRQQSNLYNRGEATVNLAFFERTKNNLLDRIMRGLP